MKILILHRIPFNKIKYDSVIDHFKNDVTYIGSSENLENIPDELPCSKYTILGQLSLYEEVLASIQKNNYFDILICRAEVDLLDAARLREKLGIPGEKYSKALITRDKILMKEVVSRAGLAVPQNVSIINASLSSKPQWNGATILKPRDGASAIGVEMHPTVESAVVRLKELSIAKDPIAIDSYQLEEFCAGEILHLDGIVKNGNVEIIIGSRYIGNCLAFAMGSPLASIQIELSEKLKMFALNCIKAVGIENSSFHLEIIDSPNGPVFLEIASRPGGAEVVDTFLHATGIHLHHEDLKLSLFREESKNIYQSHHTFCDKKNRFGWIFFPNHHLKSKKALLKGSEQFINNKLIRRIHVMSPKCEPSEKVNYQFNHMSFAAVAGPGTSEEIESLFKSMLDNILVLSESM